MEEHSFEWDSKKDALNQEKHMVSFEEARWAFEDPDRVIHFDDEHSQHEKRYYCYGFDKERDQILTVRFTHRSTKIRIIGAGYWRKGEKIYEEKNKTKI